MQRLMRTSPVIWKKECCCPAKVCGTGASPVPALFRQSRSRQRTAIQPLLTLLKRARFYADVKFHGARALKAVVGVGAESRREREIKPYTIAMVLLEEQSSHLKGWIAEILATDLNERSNRARQSRKLRGLQHPQRRASFSRQILPHQWRQAQGETRCSLRSELQPA